jgi:ubiquinone/menaquinone biosynthesis C-methylase UbiE
MTIGKDSRGSSVSKSIKRQIELNINAHDKVSSKYEQIHGEIYNPVEQRRLRERLSLAQSYIQNGPQQKQALDFGCGAGNLTHHLLELGLQVTAADVSSRFLKMVAARFAGLGAVETILLNGTDLTGVAKDRFDLVATYSVLHHVPEYLPVVAELTRVLSPGGVIFLDHEANDSFWNPTDEYMEFLRLVSSKPKWTRYVRPACYYHKLRLTLDPRYQPEGDIHTYPDDHIEWDKIETVLQEQGCEILLKEDYLLCKAHYPSTIYADFKMHCSDMRLLMARKPATCDRVTS